MHTNNILYFPVQNQNSVFDETCGNESAHLLYKSDYYDKQSIMHNFDKAAYKYDHYATIQRQVADTLFYNISSIATKANTIADLGSGTGYIHELLRKNGIKSTLYQIDLSYSMCEIASDYSSPPEYGQTFTINADFSNIPVKDELFDMVVSTMALHWSNNLKETFSVINNKMKNNAVFSFAIPINNSLSELKNSFAELDNNHHVNSFITDDELVKLLEQAGFRMNYLKIKTHTHNFNNIFSLLKSIKGVGANYHYDKSGFPGKNYFNKLNEIYFRKYGDDNNIPLTFEIGYVICSKG